MGAAPTAVSQRCIYLENVGSTNYIRSASINAQGNAPGDGIYTDGGAVVSIEDIHLEQCANGINFAGSNGAVKNIFGHPTVASLVTISVAEGSIKIDILWHS